MKERRDYWPRIGETAEPALDGDTWPCGHPRTPVNSAPIGKGRSRCRLCRRKISRESFRRRHGKA